MKSDVKRDEKRDYIKKGEKNQGQISRNQIVQTIERPKLNSSVFETKNNGYNIEDDNIFTMKEK